MECPRTQLRYHRQVNEVDMPEGFKRTMKLVAVGARIGLTTGFAMFPGLETRSAVVAACGTAALP